MMKFIENKFIEEFKTKDFFTRIDIRNFLENYEPDIKEGTLGWRIYELNQKNIIKSVKRGLYTVSNKKEYAPAISPQIFKLSKKIQERYEDINYCMWNSSWLNEFSRHQTTKNLLIIEIEKEFVESLYYYIKDNFKFDTYLNPDSKVINFYIAESKHPVIIKKLITKSPLTEVPEKNTKISVATVEKIMVDIYADKEIFHFYEGAERAYIYENIIRSYSINFTTLFSYAGRREKKDELKSYLHDIVGKDLKKLIHD